MFPFLNEMEMFSFVICKKTAPYIHKKYFFLSLKIKEIFFNEKFIMHWELLSIFIFYNFF